MMAVTASQRLMSQKDRGKFMASFLNDSVVGFDSFVVFKNFGFFDDDRFSGDSG